MNTYEIARALVSAGVSIFPVRLDGSKAPAVESWTPYRKRLPTERELQDWYLKNRHGMAIPAGKPPEGVEFAPLEFIDIDDPTLVDPFLELMREHGGADLLAKLPIIETPRGGRHLGYRCEKIAGSQKLAQRCTGCDEHGKPIIVTLIETRGEGGYVVAAGSPPECHPTRRLYKLLQGDYTTIPTITPEERALLLDLARSFNEWVPDSYHVGSSRNGSAANGNRPGDDYNARCSLSDVILLLESGGWQKHKERGNGVSEWRRPNKQGRGISATLGHVGDKVFYNFSSNAYPFEPFKAYAPFALYTMLEHGGDFKAAARELAKKGYGQQKSKTGANPVKVIPPLTCEPSGEHIPFSDVEEVVTRWLLLPKDEQDKPDTTPFRITLATVVANKFACDPVWLFIIQSSSSLKTEIIRALRGIPGIYSLSDLTPQTLASGYKSEKDVSLLPKLSRHILTLKDFTTVLSMNRDRRQEILAQLREIYDGYYEKAWGTGKQLNWKGKVGFIAGCTPVIDTHHAVLQVLGERWVQLRLESADRQEVVRLLERTRGKETAMREELQDVCARFIGGLPVPNYADIPLSDDLTNRLAALTDLATAARSAVIRDGYKRTIELIPEAEGTGRMAKQFMAILCALAVVRDATTPNLSDYALIYRLALDSIPHLRRKVLVVLNNATDYLSTSAIAEIVSYPTNSVRFALEELHGFGLVDISKGGQGYADKWVLSDSAKQNLEAAAP